jgi:threonine dehydratase
MTTTLIPITQQEIFRARRRIVPLVRHTPLVACPWLSETTGGSVRLKLENQQLTGSFKVRGAANKLLSLNAEDKARGVITVSTGNHGRGVAYAADQLGISAWVCLSNNVPQTKVEAIQRLGAQVEVSGNSYDEAEEQAARLQVTRGLTYVHPFDDPLVIAGQGTIGLELLEDYPELDTVLVPLSGGGLIAGIALALKSANPSIRVIGVSMEQAPVMVYSLRAGRVLELPEEPTLADALAGGIGKDNRYTFRMVRQWVDETALVSEEEIASAMAFALRRHHQVVEGGGAVGLAALLHRRVSVAGRQVAVVISGGNVDVDHLCRIMG